MTRPPLAILAGLFVALVVALGIAGCTPAERDYYGTTKPLHGPEEIWTNNTEPEYLDPNLASGSPGGVIIRNTFAGLTQAHPSTQQPIPDMAEGWSVSDDGLHYTFYLRDSAWSDGTPVRAADFEYSWKRLLNPLTGSKYMTFLHVLDAGEHYSLGAIELMPPSGADATEAGIAAWLQAQGVTGTLERLEEHPSGRRYIYLGREGVLRSEVHRQAVTKLKGAWGARITPADRVGVHAISDKVLEVTLASPIPFFLEMTSFYVTMPVPRHLLERLREEGVKEAYWTRPEHVVSNGPYVLKKHAFRNGMELERNPHYWDVGSVRTPTIKLSMVENSNTALNLYKSGAFDYIGENTKPPSESIDFIRGFKDFHLSPYYCVYFYWFNVEAEPTNDVRVRKAMTLAIDRQQLVDRVLRQDQQPTGALVPDDLLPDYEGPDVAIYDVEEARRLLAEAGYPKGEGFPETTLKYNTLEGHKQLAIAIQAMWKKNLGIEVNIENQEWGVYLQTVRNMDFELARQGWIGDYIDPYTFLELLKSDNENNHSLWKNPKYDAILRRSMGEQDVEKRAAMLREAETILLNDQPILPVYVYTRGDMWKPYVKGIWPNIQSRHYMKYWYIDEADDRPLNPPPVLQPNIPDWVAAAEETAAP